MNMVSFTFLLFITAVLIVYFIAPVRLRWIVLLLASYAFYWKSSHRLVVVLLFETLVTYAIGRWIGSVQEGHKALLKEQGSALSRPEKKVLKEKTKKKTRRILLLGVFLDLGTLLVLKYGNFFVHLWDGIAAKAGISLPVLRVIIPLGISFYTLQALAYMIDIYRGKITPDRNVGKFMLFMSYFPQLVQGPIPRHSQLAHQLYEGHSFDYERVAHGAQLMLWGYMKKMIIADRVAVPVVQLFDNYTLYHGPLVLFAGILYGLQIYADFSGGIDIVRGFSKMLGIDLEINFSQPYFSRSVEEFWRRWHITLGGWMRDYIFYPLSLSGPFTTLGKKTRKVFGMNFGKKLPAFLSMFIVYLLVGFWHGPEWKYVAYGIWNGLFIMTGIMFAETYEKMRMKAGIPGETFSWRLFQMLRTFLICSIGRFFSRGADLHTALHMIGSVFRKWWDFSFLTDGTLTGLGLDTANWILLIFAVAILWAVGMLHERGVSICAAIDRQPFLFRWAVYISAILCLAVVGIYGPAYNAASFIYGGF